MERPAEQPLGQRLAVDKLHDEEVDVVVRADVVEVADVRMVEGGDRAGFALEALASFLVAGQLFRQDFDGDQAMSRVSRA